MGHGADARRGLDITDSDHLLCLHEGGKIGNEYLYATLGYVLQIRKIYGCEVKE